MRGILLVLIISMAFFGFSCDSGDTAEEPGPAAEEVAADTSSASQGTAPEPEASEEAPTQEATAQQTGPQGSWDTTMGEMVLTVGEDGSVSGEYPLGTIQGSMEGNTLHFTYSEGSLAGEGSFTFSEDFDSFSGLQDIEGTELVWEGGRL